MRNNRNPDKIKKYDPYSRKAAEYDKSLEEVPVEDIAGQIDTTLTAEQQAYVDSLKKQMRGGANSFRCTFL